MPCMYALKLVLECVERNGSGGGREEGRGERMRTLKNIFKFAFYSGFINYLLKY